MNDTNMVLSFSDLILVIQKYSHTGTASLTVCVVCWMSHYIYILLHIFTVNVLKQGCLLLTFVFIIPMKKMGYN